MCVDWYCDKMIIEEVCCDCVVGDQLVLLEIVECQLLFDQVDCDEGEVLQQDCVVEWLVVEQVVEQVQWCCGLGVQCEVGEQLLCEQYNQFQWWQDGNCCDDWNDCDQ